MRLDGTYANPYTRTPDRIHASGTPEEFHRVQVDPTDSSAASGDESESESESGRTWHADLPAERPLVARIAKAVEVQCDDQRLIDWMADASDD